VDCIILKLESYCCYGHFEAEKLPFLCERNSISDGFLLGIPIFCEFRFYVRYSSFSLMQQHYVFANLFNVEAILSLRSLCNSSKVSN
jgi:hypothetical protein